MYVCMSVRNEFTNEIYRFMHNLGNFLHVPLCDGMEIEVEGSEDRRRRQNESRCMEDS